MDVVITSLSRKHSGEVVVEFTSDYGEAAALWADEPPAVGRSYQVDVEIDELFQWDENLRRVSDGAYDIRCRNGRILLKGVLESGDSPGTAAFRLGEDLIMIEMEDDLPALPAHGVCVCLDVAEMELHPHE